jgi:hypothetical protein
MSPLLSMTTVLVTNKGLRLGSDISLSLSGPEPAMIGLGIVDYSLSDPIIAVMPD